MTDKTPKSEKDYGSHVVLNGQRLSLTKHPTDFSVMAEPGQIDPAPFQEVASISPSLLRASAADSSQRDQLMETVREKNIAHHIYRVDGTDEELVIDDRIFLTLQHESVGELEKIMREYKLEYEKRMGEAHVLRLTDATRRNPVKLANELAERREVAACTPEVTLEMRPAHAPALFAEQWYLNADGFSHPDMSLNADIDAPEAWELSKGDKDIVIAVIDDGFDLDHPAFSGVRIHPDKWNFADDNDDPSPGERSYHGTPVASIAVGAHYARSPMRGIAPKCTFLPIRIGFGRRSQVDILDIFRYVSARADVVNCSFGLPPSSFDPMDRNFRQELRRLGETGGRRGKGLVIVFSAANDDAPTYLSAADNVQGVLFTRRLPFGGTGISGIGPGLPVYSGYPMTPGVVVVGAMSSLRRKSGYSCWGPHLTVAAPSNNMHYIAAFVAPGSDLRRDRFVADYRGLGQVAAVNRPGHGDPFDPIGRVDDARTPRLRENEYTRHFGGTSGAAPVVSGVAALILSVNPELSAPDVRQILMATADTDLDFTLDLADDPNLQGLGGEFVAGHSRYFGAGKVNAFHAVRRAKALRAVQPEPAAAAIAPPRARPEAAGSRPAVEAGKLEKSLWPALAKNLSDSASETSLDSRIADTATAPAPAGATEPEPGAIEVFADGDFKIVAGMLPADGGREPLLNVKAFRRQQAGGWQCVYWSIAGGSLPV